MKYVYIGTESDIGAIQLRSFGQHVELDPETAREAIAGGCPILPVEEFDAIGFDAEEIKAFAKPGPRAGAPDAFHEKHHAAMLRVHAIREDK